MKKAKKLNIKKYKAQYGVQVPEDQSLIQDPSLQNSLGQPLNLNQNNAWNTQQNYQPYNPGMLDNTQGFNPNTGGNMGVGFNWNTPPNKFSNMVANRPQAPGTMQSPQINTPENPYNTRGLYENKSQFRNTPLDDRYNSNDILSGKTDLYQPYQSKQGSQGQSTQGQQGRWNLDSIFGPSNNKYFNRAAAFGNAAMASINGVKGILDNAGNSIRNNRTQWQEAQALTFAKRQFLENSTNQDFEYNRSQAYFAHGGNIQQSWNPDLANQDKKFLNWYKKNTIEGKNNIPYSENNDYDYYSFYKNGGNKSSKNGHFPDTYKRTNHETFSNESIYSTPENPGGFWVGENYNPIGKFQYEFGGDIGMHNYKAENGANVEVEGQEMLQTPNGLAGPVYGPPHSQGGIDMQLPQGTKVFSEKLKDSKTKKSYAQMAKPYSTEKDVKNLKSKFTDKIGKATADLNIKLKNENLDELFQKQEIEKLTGLHGSKVQQEAMMAQGYMKNGGQLPKAGNGWINTILNFESNTGSTQGTGLQNYGIQKAKWNSKYPKMWEDDKITQEEAIDFIEKEYLPKVKDYPEDVQKRLVDYAYNTGRNIEDVLLLASGKKDLNSIQTKSTDFNLFNKEKSNIIKNMSDPSFLNKIDDAKSVIMQDYWKRQGTPEVYNATSAPRIGMWNNQTSNTNNTNTNTTATAAAAPTSNYPTYIGGKYPSGKNTPGSIKTTNEFRGTKDQYTKDWGDSGLDLSGFKTAKEVQEATYKELLKTPEGRDRIREMWKYGNTALGIKKGIGKGLDFNNLSDEDLLKVLPAYTDDMLGVRTLTPVKKQPPVPPKTPAPPTATQRQGDQLGPETEFDYRKATQGQNPNYMDLMGGFNIPGNYAKAPISTSSLTPEYIDPRYLNIQPQLNQVQRGYNAFKSNLGSRTSADVANLLQAQTNAYNQNEQIYGQKYNYDRGQDSQAQQFNAQANMRIDQLNQAELNNFTDKIYRRDGALDTQMRMDSNQALENDMLRRNYAQAKHYINSTFMPNATDEPWNPGYVKPKETKDTKKHGGKIKLNLKKKLK
jgi:hypothetical protein